jgi:hypothetical protein
MVAVDADQIASAHLVARSASVAGNALVTSMAAAQTVNVALGAIAPQRVHRPERRHACAMGNALVMKVDVALTANAAHNVHVHRRA